MLIFRVVPHLKRNQSIRKAYILHIVGYNNKFNILISVT